MQTFLAALAGIFATGSDDTGAVKRGREALLGRAFSPPSWRPHAHRDAWKVWGVGRRPKNYPAAFQARYGLAPAPYPNNGLPMGLRRSQFLFARGIAMDCLICHGGSVIGKSIVGLGNSSLDLDLLARELSRAGGQPPETPFRFSRGRGTNEASAAAVYLLGLRRPNLGIKVYGDLGLRDDLIEDVPAWWLLKKKRTMYHTGPMSADSARSIMQFMMHPLNTGRSIRKEESTFQDVLAYIKSIKPPKYPFAIDRQLAKRGRAVFNKTCAACHGTYGDDWTYPNKIIPMGRIRTDPHQYKALSEKFFQAYNRSWFGAKHKLKKTGGYQAPPLDGVWATAPYFHNGSVPTVYHVLNSEARPRVFIRSFGTTESDFDKRRLGWKYRPVPADPKDRRIYDTTKRGRGNQGHTFGDHLSEAERAAVIEYLKSL